MVKGFPSLVFVLVLFLCLGCSGSFDLDDGVYEYVILLDVNIGFLIDIKLLCLIDFNMFTLDFGMNIFKLDLGTMMFCLEDYDGGVVFYFIGGNGKKIVKIVFSLN